MCLILEVCLLIVGALPGALQRRECENGVFSPYPIQNKSSPQASVHVQWRRRAPVFDTCTESTEVHQVEYVHGHLFGGGGSFGDKVS